MKTIVKPVGRSCFCFFAALFLMLVTSHVQAQRANFSGAWVIDEEKSNLGELGISNLFNKRMITQNEKQMVIEDIIEDRRVISTLSLNGSPVERKLERPERKRVSTIKWLNDRSLEITHTDDTGKEVYKTISVCSLMADGKTMTIEGSVDYKPNDTVYKYRLVLNRQ